ncbi:PREDICTED: beta carbonic anhydrase 5, chloroplastic-like isoform X2 [Nelumbo nucifera]|uniref:Carbonic anhydrase n=2 Tax=Nelumbo nucifera TaxID=4432 RepID=A0A1U7ZMK5_NELNU|nr:PREDICTED: beta carbonic anhydrase 5, chloroplastic-like isoform X2 [Nelumbo nucifera]
MRRPLNYVYLLRFLRLSWRQNGSAMAALRPSTAPQPQDCSAVTFLRPRNSFLGLSRTSLGITRIYGSREKLGKFEEAHLRSLGSNKSDPTLRVEASRDSAGLAQEITNNNKLGVNKIEQGLDLFGEMKNRFLSFKRHKYLENSEHFEKLSKAQAPKFMVIACADSRVCPSTILGFQPGDAFMIRNVANLVPPVERPSETNAALEFAVNTLEVENIFVIGHSCCGGIQALMSMPDEIDRSSFIRNWVVVGKKARLSTKAVAANLSFDQQCRHCEKESINQSILNLLTYPWIEERVGKGVLSIHGGYYDFTKCTFEKWTLDYKRSNVDKEGRRVSIKDQAFWC